MIISIAILLLARRVYSSFQGSTFNEETNANKLSADDLNVNKLSADNFNELFEEFKEAFLKGQIRLMIDLGEKIIDIQKMIQTNGRTDRRRNFLGELIPLRQMDLSDDFERMIPINAAEFKHTHTLNYPISKTGLIMKKMVDDIGSILRRMTLMQKHNSKDKKLTYQNLFYNNNFRRNATPQGHRNSMNLNRVFKQFEPSRTSSDGKFEKEKLDLKSKLEMFSEYIKSVHDNLLWLSKLLDVKRHELNRVFDDIIKRKLLNLRKRAQFLLENLIEKEELSKSEKYQDFPIDKHTSNVSNIENIESNNATILSNKRDKENLNKTDKTILLTQETKANFDEINNKTRTMNENIAINQITNPKMRILDNTESKNETKSEHRNLVNTNEEFATEKSIRIANNFTTNDHLYPEKKIYRKENVSTAKTSTQKRISSKLKKSKRTTNRSNKLEDHGSQLDHSKDIRAVLRKSSRAGISTKDNDQKQTGSNILHESSRKNVTDAATNPSRRMLQASGHKSETRKQINQHDISGNNNVTNPDNSDGKLQAKQSAMDMIIEALDEILPPQKPAEMMSTKVIS